MRSQETCRGRALAGPRAFPPRSVSDRILRERAAQSALLTEEDVSASRSRSLSSGWRTRATGETSFVREVCPLTNFDARAVTPALVARVITFVARSALSST